MSVTFGRAELLSLLYGYGSSRRYTQDSPILPEVWLGYVENPNSPQDLLLTPYQPPHQPPTEPAILARAIQDRLKSHQSNEGDDTDLLLEERIAYHRSAVAVRLSFTQLLQIVLPMSQWWKRRVLRDASGAVVKNLRTKKVQSHIVSLLIGSDPSQVRSAWKLKGRPTIPADVACLLQVVGTIHQWIKRNSGATVDPSPPSTLWPPPAHPKQAREYLDHIVESASELIRGVMPYDDDHTATPAIGLPLVYYVNRNRVATATLWRSTVTTKADAADRVFEIDCRNIRWAMLDTGIEARLPAFRRREGGAPRKITDYDNGTWDEATRVVATYDFTYFRQLLSGDFFSLPSRIAKKLEPKLPQVKKLREELLASNRAFEWDAWEPILKIPHNEHYVAPEHPHGTHVAGILAAEWLPGEFEKDSRFGRAGVSAEGHVPGYWSLRRSRSSCRCYGR